MIKKFKNAQYMYNWQEKERYFPTTKTFFKIHFSGL